MADPTRPIFNHTGWTCHGRDLTILMFSGGIPCVLPTSMVDDALQEPWAAAYNPVPYAGGDHYHLMKPATASPAPA